MVACSSKRQPGAYYQDDGPGNRKVDVTQIPDATPRNEAINQATSKPYKIRGKRYIPLQSAIGFRQQGYASWYGKKYHGRKTSNGEVYDMFAMTAAHTTLPIPSYVRVTNVLNQRSVVVRINDRGPFIGNRVIDLSYVAAKKLGIAASGTGKVLVEAVSSSRTETSLSSLVTGVPKSYSPQQRYDDSTRQSQPLLDRAAQPQAVPQVQSSSTHKWFQVGAFSILKNADSLKTRLFREGFTSSQVVHVAGLYKVIVGPVNTSESVDMSQRLKNSGYPVKVFKE